MKSYRSIVYTSASFHTINICNTCMQTGLKILESKVSGAAVRSVASFTLEVLQYIHGSTNSGGDSDVSMAKWLPRYSL